MIHQHQAILCQILWDFMIIPLNFKQNPFSLIYFHSQNGRERNLALLMVDFAYQLMQLLDHINRDSFQVLYRLIKH